MITMRDPKAGHWTTYVNFLKSTTVALSVACHANASDIDPHTLIRYLQICDIRLALLHQRIDNLYTSEGLAALKECAAMVLTLHCSWPIAAVESLCESLYASFYRLEGIARERVSLYALSEIVEYDAYASLQAMPHRSEIDEKGGLLVV